MTAVAAASSSKPLTILEEVQKMAPMAPFVVSINIDFYDV
jgi:hypothetical protein